MMGLGWRKFNSGIIRWLQSVGKTRKNANGLLPTDNAEKITSNYFLGQQTMYYVFIFTLCLFGK